MTPETPARAEPVGQSALLSARLGQRLVLARAGERALHVLDPLASWVWEARQAGLGEAETAERLAARFAQPSARTLADVQCLTRQWRALGLLEHAPPTDAATPPVACEAPTPLTLPDGARWRLRMADRTCVLGIADPALTHALAPMLEHLRVSGTGEADYALALTGAADDWTLQARDRPPVIGRTRDEAVFHTLHALVELGCRGEERLLVAHGAGIVHAGQGWLLVGHGGAGKTTLTAALNAAGFPLLSDDLVPVGLDGALFGLGLPLCLKAGAWPVLDPRLPSLAPCPIWRRHDQLVRLPPPPGPVAHGPVPLGGLIVVRYAPEHPTPDLTRLAPEEALQHLMEAQAFLPPLTPPRLAALVRWIAAAPAFRLTYPDLETGLQGVEQVVGREAVAS